MTQEHEAPIWIRENREATEAERWDALARVAPPETHHSGNPVRDAAIEANKAILADLRANRVSQSEATAAFLERHNMGPSYNQKLYAEMDKEASADRNANNWTLLERAVENLKPKEEPNDSDRRNGV